MSRRSVKTLTTIDDRNHEKQDIETDARKFTHTVTVTQKDLTRRCVGNMKAFNYQIDPWEMSPKTDYTYSSSQSYVREPRNENYESPNMSRRGIRGNYSNIGDSYSSNSSGYNQTSGCDMTSDTVRNSSMESFNKCNTGVGGGLGRSGEVDQNKKFQGSTSVTDSTYMILRSRTLKSQHQKQSNTLQEEDVSWTSSMHDSQFQGSSSGWKENDTFQIQNMHGTDFEEEISQLEYHHDQHESKESLSAEVFSRPSVLGHILSHIVSVVQISCAVLMFLPRKTISKVSSLFIESSENTDANQQHITKCSKLSDLTAKVVTSDSLWRKAQRTMLSVLGFLLVTLPVGLISWTVFGMISSVKASGGLFVRLWQWFESILNTTVTKSSRTVDAAVLSRTSALRRHCGCLSLLLFLVLFPILLIGVLYASSCLRNDVAIFASDTVEKLSMVLLPLFYKNEGNITETTIEGMNKGEKTHINTNDITLLGVTEMEKRVHDLFHDLAANYKIAAEAEQNQTLFNFQSHLNDLVKVLVRRELQIERDLLSVQVDSLKIATDDSRSSLIAEQKRQLSLIAEMRKSLEVLTNKAQELSEGLSLLKANFASHDGVVKIDNSQKVLDLGDNINKVSLELIQLKDKYDRLATEMSHWSTQEQTTVLIRTRIHEYFKQVMNAGVVDSSGATDSNISDNNKAFGAWLSSHFATRADLDKILIALAANITKQINEKAVAIKDEAASITAATILAASDSKKTQERYDNVKDSSILNAGFTGKTDGFAEESPCVLCPGQVTEEDVLKLIHVQLGIYDADKTGKADYALETAGGSIISVRCSQTYQLQTAQTSIFGIPIWYTYNSPRVIIQPGVQPGECWAINGSQGYVVIQLSRQIFINEVAIEHIPRALAPSRTIESAPKEFEIWGLESETDGNGKFLGNFTYDSAGTPLQSFQIQNSTGMSFKFVELKILSNHGHEMYTCLYRFRVHGSLDLSLPQS